MMVLLPCVAVFVLFNRQRLDKESRFEQFSRSRIFLGMLATGLLIGMYDGFFGPGTGTPQLFQNTIAYAQKNNAVHHSAVKNKSYANLIKSKHNTKIITGRINFAPFLIAKPLPTQLPIIEKNFPQPHLSGHDGDGFIDWDV